MKDIIIIGAGIIGSFLAYDLSNYDLDCCVLEKNSDVGCGVTKANSAIVHSGHDPKEGTLKAKLNVLGNRMYEDICKTLNCQYNQIGAYVLACSCEEEKKLMELYHQAVSRDIPCEIQKREVIMKKEPHLSDEVISGLYLPTTAIITPWEVSIACMENAVERGTELHLNTEVISIEKSNQGYRIETTKGSFETKMILNCAGVYADEIAKMIHPVSKLSIKARRGEYFVLDHTKEPIVNHILYPIPSTKGKGVLTVPTIHKNVLLGPTSDFIEDKDEVNTTKVGLDSIRSQLSKLVKDVPMHQVIRTFSGNRPVGSTGDFIIQEDELNPLVFHVAAIESPGIASAPAISRYVIDELISKKVELHLKKELPEIIQRPKLLSHMSEQERIEKIKQDPRFGHIVCRCEKISEGEIIEVMHRNVPVTTIGAIKRRVRPGMGRCQGGFCEPLVLHILARELGINPLEITSEESGSFILMKER